MTFSDIPAFETPLFVGRPNIGNTDDFLTRVKQILNSRWFSNDGAFVKHFETALKEYLNVKHCILMCNATVALEIVTKALDLKGEVILPSYTFVASAHALKWQGVKPIFCEVDPATHLIDLNQIETLITPNTTGIMGVHLWGNACNIRNLVAIADRYRLKLFFDSSHALGATYQGKMLGNFGNAEVFSFHATKFLNSFEGGCVTTNDDELAERMRLMRNFGFSGFDQVDCLGINGKMSEVSAAMGLTNLEAIEAIVQVNRDNFYAYQSGLSGIGCLKLLLPPVGERSNYQYVVVEVIAPDAARLRDEIISFLHRNNVIARKYFWPCCHRMEPYKSEGYGCLPVTESLAERVLVLPTGQSVSPAVALKICHLIKSFLNQPRG